MESFEDGEPVIQCAASSKHHSFNRTSGNSRRWLLLGWHDALDLNQAKAESRKRRLGWDIFRSVWQSQDFCFVLCLVA